MEAQDEPIEVEFNPDPDALLVGYDRTTTRWSKLYTENSLLCPAKKHSETVLLEQLVRKGSKPVKKEYLRTQLIRGHKKKLRKLKQLKRKAPRLFSSSDLDQKFFEVYDANRPLFNLLAHPSSGPLTDGTRRPTKFQIAEKTWNNSSCSQYFENPAVRESFYYYTESIFQGMCPVKLAEYFKARCCDQPTHTPGCHDLWSQIKEFVQVGLLENLGLAPFQPDSEPNKEWPEEVLL